MALYAATIFLSAFLLFQVQPLIGRYLLPWFGGTPSVWTTCLLFFQAVLFAGYLYAHGLSKLAPGRQRRLHAAFLLAAGALLALSAVVFGTPLAPPGLLRPDGSGVPALRVLGLLAATVGLPYLLLSSTGPLLQAWAARLPEPERVWRLFALSNLGSLLALLAYPFAVEPALSLRAQAWSWSILFLLFAAAAAISAVRQARSGAGPESLPPPDPGPPPDPADRRLWIALPACSSILLMATTNQMCQEVAVVPLLWVLPLSLYLVTFILCFEAPRVPWRPIASVLFLLSIGPVVYVLQNAVKVRVPFQVATYAVALFAGCLVCHGELYRLRPAPGRLTGFYLAVAGGGALGGVLVGAVAPLLFQGYWEYPGGLLLCGGLLVARLGRSAKSPALGRILAGSGVVALAIAAASLLVAQVVETRRGAVSLSRNFYGVLRVREELPGDADWHLRALTHGRIQHGFQYLAADRRRQPTTYYTEASGVGRALRAHPRRAAGESLRIGVVGLGVGTLAAYTRPGDVIRFYEINPDVVALSRGPDPRFTFLADARGTVEVVEGDARLSLERELARGAPQRFDLLVLDAFSSDAIPVHLLTAEAFAAYLPHLRDEDSILAVHTSNRQIRLEPVLLEVARRFALAAVESETDPPGAGSSRSAWVLLSRRSEVLSRPEIAAAAVPLSGHGRRVSLWTDDYSNLFGVVTW
jgi:hypothetical protein